MDSPVPARRILKSLAAVDATRLGAIRFATQKARAFLERYFPGEIDDQLPRPLVDWLRIPALGAFVAAVPWIIERGDRQLVVRLIGSEGRCFQLLLEELPVRSFCPKQLERLGLTRRQAEVLLWLAQGKTSPEIATILGCKTRTVSKHTERIFAKLRVETRTAAAAIALEVSSFPGR